VALERHVVGVTAFEGEEERLIPLPSDVLELIVDDVLIEREGEGALYSNFPSMRHER
jgi:hypothetical protein